MLVTALLPLLAARHTNCIEPKRGAAEGTTPPGERLTGVPGGRPGQETHGEPSPVFLVKETVPMVDSIDVGRFYRDVIWALGEHAIRGGTPFGAAAVVKRLGKEHGIPEAEYTPLPRSTRAEREEAAWQRSRGRK